MFSVPYSSICISQVVPTAAADANGTAALTCVLCNADKSLQIRDDGADCHCDSCLAADDIIGLYARSSEISIPKALDEMFASGIITGDRSAFDRYANERVDYDILENIIEEGKDRIHAGEWPSAIALLQALDIDVEFGYGIKSIASRVGVIHPSDLSSLSMHPEFAQAAKWMRKSACLVTPLYEYRTRAGGILIINKNGDHCVARLQGRDSNVMEQGTLFARHVKRLDEAVIVTTDAMSSWTAVTSLCRLTEPLIPMVGVWSSDHMIRPIRGVGDRTYIFWSHTITDSYQWSELHMGSLISTEPWTCTFNALSTQQLIVCIVDAGLDRHEAMASYLATTSEEAARDIIAGMQQQVTNLNAIIAAANPVQRAYVRALIVGHAGPASVRYCSKEVHAHNDGWSIDGELVADAIIHLDNTFVTDGSAYITGIVQFQGSSYEFHDKLSIIRKGATWLEGFLLSKDAPLPYVARRWRTHLFEIAMQFHRPTTVSSARQVGWNNKYTTLTLPNFLIDSGGIHPVEYINTDTSMSGSGLDIPELVPDASVRAGSEDETLWYIFVFILSHLLRGRVGCELPPLVLHGAGAAAWISVIQKALHLRHMSTADVASVTAQERNSILPIIVEPTGDASFVDWVHKSDHTAIVRLSGSVVPLMKYHGWLTHEVTELPAPYVQKILPLVFWLVAYSIQQLDSIAQESVNKGPFWAISACVMRWVTGTNNGLHEAQSALYRDHGRGKMAQNNAGTLLSLIRNLADGGFISFEDDSEDRYVRIVWAEVVDRFTEFSFKSQSYHSARKLLKPYLFAAPCDDGVLLIQKIEWVIKGTFVG